MQLFLLWLPGSVKAYVSSTEMIHIAFSFFARSLQNLKLGDQFSILSLKSSNENNIIRFFRRAFFVALDGVF